MGSITISPLFLQKEWVYPDRNIFSTKSNEYGKCPKISYTKVSDKMIYTNIADPDQIAPEGAIWSGSTCLPVGFYYYSII